MATTGASIPSVGCLASSVVAPRCSRSRAHATAARQLGASRCGRHGLPSLRAATASGWAHLLPPLCFSSVAVGGRPLLACVATDGRLCPPLPAGQSVRIRRRTLPPLRASRRPLAAVGGWQLRAAAAADLCYCLTPSSSTVDCHRHWPPAPPPGASHRLVPLTQPPAGPARTPQYAVTGGSARGVHSDLGIAGLSTQLSTIAHK